MDGDYGRFKVTVEFTPMRKPKPKKASGGGGHSTPATRLMKAALADYEAQFPGHLDALDKLFTAPGKISTKKGAISWKAK
jgi:hypothetical protein